MLRFFRTALFVFLAMPLAKSFRSTILPLNWRRGAPLAAATADIAGLNMPQLIGTFGRLCEKTVVLAPEPEFGAPTLVGVDGGGGGSDAEVTLLLQSAKRGKWVPCYLEPRVASGHTHTPKWRTALFGAEPESATIDYETFCTALSALPFEPPLAVAGSASAKLPPPAMALSESACARSSFPALRLNMRI